MNLQISIAFFYEHKVSLNATLLISNKINNELTQNIYRYIPENKHKLNKTYIIYKIK